MDWKEHYRRRRTTAEQAVAHLRAGSRVLLGSGSGEPRRLVRALDAQSGQLTDLELVQVLALANQSATETERPGTYRYRQLFLAAGARQAVSEGRADYTPVYLSDVPALLQTGRLAIDAALIQVSPPDEHGYVSLGVAVDVMADAVEQARVVVAQVNPRMPRTHGQSFVHVRELDHIVEFAEPLAEFAAAPPGRTAQEVARRVARLIGNGSTIQCGLGELPQAVLGALKNKRNLGVHTDMLTEGYVDLVEAGAVTGQAKTIHHKTIVASFCLGGARLYRFVHDNPMVEMHPVRHTNDPAVIAQNPRMTAVHEVLEVDLTGQVCADVLGGRIYSGVGSVVDFMRGAAGSPGGQAIVVLTSTWPDGSSRILPALAEGAGVGLSRAAVRTVVTEHGAAHLHGLSIRERALALIDIAHPNHRDALLTAARDKGFIRAETIMVPLFTGVYPDKYERVRQLPDETRIFLRPVKPTDERLVQEFFYAMSDSEVYYRFLHGIKAFPTKDMQKMVNIDYHRQMCLVALEGEFGDERLVGLARYVLPDDGPPEVDFAVRGGMQGRGLGRLLVDELLKVAQDRGYKEVAALVLSDNRASLHILTDPGYAVTGTVSQGVTHLVIHLDQPVEEKTLDLSYEQPRRGGGEHMTQI